MLNTGRREILIRLPGRAALHRWLAPFLLLLSFSAAATGQYLLSVRSDGRHALLAYSIGVGAFVLLVLQTHRPTTPRTVAGEGAYFKVSLSALATFLAAVALALALLALNEWPALPLWLASLMLATLAAWTRDAAISFELRGLAARLRAREVALEASALAAITLVGAALRLFRLAGFPTGIHGDETGFGLIAVDVLQGNGPNPFGTAFLGDPALFVYLEAPFIAIFGHTITALRLPAALAGVAALPAFYFLVRRMFGKRAALLALGLLAGSALSVNFSRLALNVAELPFFGSVLAYLLYRGTDDPRARWWLPAGLVAGLSVYFHFGGRLFPIMALAYVAYLLISRRNLWLTWLRSAGLATLGGAMALAPMAIYLSRQSYKLTEHVSSRLIFNNWPRVAAAQHATTVPAVLFDQLRTNVLAFFSGVDSSTFYTFTGFPLLPAVIAPLVALGLVFLAIQIHQPRCALLAIWFWVVVIIGGALSIDSPQAHRLFPALLPALAGAAVVLDWVIGRVAMTVGSGLAIIPTTAALLAVGLAGYVDEHNYFGPAATARPFEPTTVQAQFVAALGPSYWVYDAGTPYVYFGHSVTRFLASTVSGDDLQNPGVEVPAPAPADRSLAFLLYPHTLNYLPVLQTTYPRGRTQTVNGHAGTVFTAYLVAQDDVASWQGLTARYENSSRLEAADALGGGADRYPADVTWTGGLYASQKGPYVIEAGGVPASMTTDGAAVAVGQPIELGIGWHQLDIAAQLVAADKRLSLTWRPPRGQTEGIPSKFLDGRPVAGHLLGQVSTAQGTSLRRDRMLDFWNLSDAVAAQPPLSATWTGTLNASAGGNYGLTVNGTGGAQLDIDGRQTVVLPDGDGVRTASAGIPLSAGPHRIRLSYRLTRDLGVLELLWKPPGDTQTTVIPPAAFT